MSATRRCNRPPDRVWPSLRFYAAHPEARGELGGQRGVQRLLRWDLG